MTSISAISNRSTATPRGFQISDVGLVKTGSSGEDVRLLQQKLKDAGFDPGPINGEYGEQTQAAITAFQTANSLKVDGIAGQQTWGALHGMQFPPGTDLLRNSGASPVSSTASPATSAAAQSASPTAAMYKSSFEDPALGPGKQVQAYVSGRATTISVHPVGNGKYMQADAAKNFVAMQKAAKAAGINLGATSGFRTMAEQQALYQKHLNGTGNLAARPGYSNHQNGISMDIGGINSYSTKAYAWMKANAANFGFVNDVKGEYWHWTYKA